MCTQSRGQFAHFVQTMHMPRPTVGNLENRPLKAHFIRQWRKHRGYTQEVAADMIGIDRSTLSKVERLESPYNQSMLDAIAETYGCEPSDLLDFDPTKPPLPKEIAVLDMYRKATPELRQAIIRILSLQAES